MVGGRGLLQVLIGSSLSSRIYFSGFWSTWLLLFHPLPFIQPNDLQYLRPICCAYFIFLLCGFIMYLTLAINIYTRQWSHMYDLFITTCIKSCLFPLVAAGMTYLKSQPRSNVFPPNNLDLVSLFFKLMMSLKLLSTASNAYLWSRLFHPMQWVKFDITNLPIGFWIGFHLCLYQSSLSVCQICCVIFDLLARVKNTLLEEQAFIQDLYICIID